MHGRPLVAATTPVVVVLLYIVVFAGGGFVVSCAHWFEGQNGTPWQTWATVLAGAIVAWYTWETRELRRATLHQTEL